MMSGIRGKNTSPEVAVRKALFARGFRFRLHDKRLPGAPDIVLPKFRSVIFVHGCFWHGHGCRAFKWPKTREEFWRAKIEGNIQRDLRVCRELRRRGWRVKIVWECSIGKGKQCPEQLVDRLCAWISKGIRKEVSK
jgi:DNA mismatch endonuclease, patch repair protein